MTGVGDAARFGARRVARDRGEASGGRPGGFAIGTFSKVRGLILPRRTWYLSCEGS